MRLDDEMRLARLGVLCAGTPDIATIEPHHSGIPSPESEAAVDAAHWKDAPPGASAWVTLLSRLWLSAATENLKGLTAIFNTTLINHPPRSLVRAALEHAGRAWWVLDGFGPVERAARSWLARWEGLREEVRIAERDGGRTGAMATAPQRLERLEHEVREIFGEAPKRGGRPWEDSLCSEQFGSTSSIVTRFAQTVLSESAAVLYGVHSHLLHPSTTGLLAFTESDGEKFTVRGADVDHWEGSILTVLGLWRGALQRVLDYHGWEHPELVEWSDALDATVHSHLSAQRRPG